MRTRFAGVLGALLLSGVLFAACGGGDGGGGQAYVPPTGPVVQTLDIESGNLYFEPDKISASAGVTTIDLTNEGGVHTLVFDDAFPGFLLEVSGGGDSDSGKVDLAPGKYTFYCNVTGHRAQGMEGTITVK